MAFFSGVDNASEVDTCTYLVIGNVTTKYTYAVRAGCNGSYTVLKLEDVFDLEDQTYYEIHQSEMVKITELKYTPPVYNGNTTYPNYVGARGAVRPYNPINAAPSSRIVTAEESWGQYYQDYYSDIYDAIDDPLVTFTPKERVAVNDNYNSVDTMYHTHLNEFATAYNLFAQAIVDDPHAADIGYTFAYDIVQLMDGLDYVPLDMMKSFFDNYYMYLTEADIQNLVQYIAQTT